MAKKINSIEAYPGRVYTLSVPLDLETTDTATYSLNLRHIRVIGMSLAGNASGASNGGITPREPIEPGGEGEPESGGMGTSLGTSDAGILLGTGNIHIWLLDGGTASFDSSTSRTTARHVKRMIDLPVAQNFVSNQVEFAPVDIDRCLNLFIQRDMSITFYGTLFIYYIYQL